MRMNNLENLCDTCKKYYKLCPRDKKEILFGIDLDPAAKLEKDDIVVACSEYQPKINKEN